MLYLSPYVMMCLASTESKLPIISFVIHPTYGTVSRYGLVPASSMDQIGIVCKDMREGFKLLLIAGNDEKTVQCFLKSHTLMIIMNRT